MSPNDTIPAPAPAEEPIPAGSAHERMEAAILRAAEALQDLCALAHAMARALDATKGGQP